MPAELSSLPPDQQRAILDGPALKAPPGLEPNFHHPPNHNIIPEAVIPICLILVALTILLRNYARVFISKKFGVEDILSLLGVGTYLFYVYSIYHVTHTTGLFVHQWHVTVRRLSEIQHLLQIAATCYTITLALIKCAILLQWIRIFVPHRTRGPFYWTCYILIWILLLFYLSTTIAGNLMCVPFQRIWDKTVPGVCINGRPLNMTISVFNLASDICILLLPQRVIWRLKLTFKRKLGVALTFAVGLLACAAAALRLGVTVNYMTDPDWFYHVASLSMACIVEMTCIILVYNMPGIPLAFRESPFLSKILSSLSSSLHSVTRRSHSSSYKDSVTAAKSMNDKGKYDPMAGHAMALENYPAPTFKHYSSTERLQSPDKSHDNDGIPPHFAAQHHN